jgi:hypothetical protein
MTTFYKQDLLQTAKRLYKYCENTGNFYWKITNTNVKPNQLAGSNHNGYIRLRIGNKQIFAHRLAWAFVYAEFPKNQIDHIDGNKANNKIVNLRDVTREVNLQNQTKAHVQNELGLQNVRQRKDSKQYQVRINSGKKGFYVGQYENVKDAVQARDIARILLSMPQSRSSYVYS